MSRAGLDGVICGVGFGRHGAPSTPPPERAPELRRARLRRATADEVCPHPRARSWGHPQPTWSTQPSACRPRANRRREHLQRHRTTVADSDGQHGIIAPAHPHHHARSVAAHGPALARSLSHGVVGAGPRHKVQRGEGAGPKNKRKGSEDAAPPPPA